MAIHLVKLPKEKPDCCAICPLLGIVPKEQRQHKSYENLVCLGTGDALTKRASEIRASQRNKKHPLHRFCDDKWTFWVQCAKGLGVNRDLYLQCRIPYEQSQQLSLNFIKFHRNTNKK